MTPKLTYNAMETVKRTFIVEINSHCFYNYEDDVFNTNNFLYDSYNIRFATEEEKEKLFKAIKANGYQWNTETKILEKLSKPKFKVGDRVKSKINQYNYTIADIRKDVYIMYYGTDKFGYHVPFCNEDNYELVSDKFNINSLKPFDKVLVRDNNKQKWTIDCFSFVDKEQVYPFVCASHYVSQCIPYENNEYLLGKTDDCNEYYKTWE